MKIDGWTHIHQRWHDDPFLPGGSLAPRAVGTVLGFEKKRLHGGVEIAGSGGSRFVQIMLFQRLHFVQKHARDVGLGLVVVGYRVVGEPVSLAINRTAQDGTRRTADQFLVQRSSSLQPGWPGRLDEGGSQKEAGIRAGETRGATD